MRGAGAMFCPAAGGLVVRYIAVKQQGRGGGGERFALRGRQRLVEADGSRVDDVDGGDEAGAVVDQEARVFHQRHGRASELAGTFNAVGGLAIGQRAVEQDAAALFGEGQRPCVGLAGAAETRDEVHFAGEAPGELAAGDGILQVLLAHAGGGLALPSLVERGAQRKFDLLARARPFVSGDAPGDAVRPATVDVDDLVGAEGEFLGKRESAAADAGIGVGPGFEVGRHRHAGGGAAGENEQGDPGESTEQACFHGFRIAEDRRNVEQRACLRKYMHICAIVQKRLIAAGPRGAKAVPFLPVAGGERVG